MNDKKKVSNKTVILILLVATLIMGICLLTYSLTYGPVPTIEYMDNHTLTFVGGKEEKVTATRTVEIQTEGRPVDFLDIRGKLYYNDELMPDSMYQRLSVSISLNNSNIVYVVGDLLEKFLYVNTNNCNIFPITKNTVLKIHFIFIIPTEYCSCRGQHVMTFDETLRVGMEV